MAPTLASAVLQLHPIVADALTLRHAQGVGVGFMSNSIVVTPVFRTALLALTLNPVFRAIHSTNTIQEPKFVRRCLFGKEFYSGLSFLEY